MADQAQNAPAAALLNLLTLMAQLRDPDTGCPWDVQQDFASIAPYTIEEAYEVADAIARGDIADLRDELGDLLLQVVFHARIAEEAGHFDSTAVAAAISDKLVRRHPHVFGDRGKISAADLKSGNPEGRRACRQRRRQGPPGKCSDGGTPSSRRCCATNWNFSGGPLKASASTGRNWRRWWQKLKRNGAN